MLPFYFAFYESPIGYLRIKSTEQSIYEVLFMDERAESDLHQPKVMLECIRQLGEYFEGQRKVFDVALNADGTAFQRRVWEHLVTIPYGRTVSYLDMSKQLGDEKSIRAVANANGKNPIGIIVPCHRVIGSDNSLTGYAGGLHRKRWLLDHEAKVNGIFSRLF